ncbi:MAG: serine/threonine-protein phosphatase, partial [Planctomycetes bacterium]|nr:serine/threonine-protein phosphatase [Planctomycetota bacterium]
MDVGLLLDIVAASDVGLQRSNNEDAFLVLEAEKFCVVADGMGGHLGGEVASSMVTETLREVFANPPAEFEKPEAILQRLMAAIQKANFDIYTRGNSDSRLRNMGTTVVATLFHGGNVIFASVGDSRIYRLREGVLTQITEDHSWVGELRKKNLISEEDARNHPLKNIIT